MELRKTIRCKLVYLTKKKRNLLSREYDNLNHWLKTGKDKGVYSANKQQARRFYKKIKDGKEYPISIRKDLMDIQRRNTKIAKYWAKIPIYGVRGGIKVGLAHQPFEFEWWEVCESKLVRKDDEFFLHVTVKRKVEVKTQYSNILAVDMGAKWVAVSVIQRPKFYGREIRATRGKYQWLRKRLGQLKKLKTIKKIGSKEKRIVNNWLHVISKKIVEDAERNNAIIVIGNLKGVRKGKNKGRKANRKINSMSFHRLKNCLQYKALERGIVMIEVPEANTSKQCSHCGSMNTKRPYQGVFICEDCVYQANADYNGTKNIKKRGYACMVYSGTVVTQSEGGRNFALLTLPTSQASVGSSPL